MKEVDLHTATMLSNGVFICSIIGTLIFLILADRKGRKDMLGNGYIQLSFSLGLFSLFSYLNIFPGQVLMMWISLFIWGKTSGVNWIVLVDYLPAKGVVFINI